MEVNVGDEVKIKKEGVIRKGYSKYSERKKVVEVFDHSLRLEDGRIWNKNRVVKCRVDKEEMMRKHRRMDRCVEEDDVGVSASVEQERKKLDEEVTNVGNGEDAVEVKEMETRPIRRRTVPERLKDYVM